MARELFFYNAATGTVGTGTLDENGNFKGLTTGGGLSKDWTHVNTVGTELFFYNAATGNVATGRLDENGNFTGLTTGGGLSKGWTHVNTVD
jgi:glucan-binding YG repeat protein